MSSHSIKDVTDEIIETKTSITKAELAVTNAEKNVINAEKGLKEAETDEGLIVCLFNIVFICPKLINYIL